MGMASMRLYWSAYREYQAHKRRSRHIHQHRRRRTALPNLAHFAAEYTLEDPAFNLFQTHSRYQANSKPAASSKGAATQMMEVSWSHSKSRARLKRLVLVRWRSILRQHHRLGRGRFILQVRQNPLDNGRIFNAAVRRLDDDLDRPRAPFAGLDIDPNAVQLNTRFNLCIQVIDWWRSAGVLSSQLSPVG